MDGFPNTYTFTKSLTEKSIVKKRGTLPTCIIRPSMTGASVAEPFPGWTDTISALGAPIFFGGLGIYSYQVGFGQQNIDLTPVDTCVNSILICTAYTAHHPEKVQVFNHSTSGLAVPLTQKQYNESYTHFYKYYPFDKQISKPSLTFTGSPTNRDMLIKYTKILPIQAVNFFAKATANSKLQQDSKKFLKVNQMFFEANKRFEYFEYNCWKFMNKKSIAIMYTLEQEEQDEFNCDVGKIEWDSYLKNYARGMQIYALKQDQVEIKHNMTQILIKNKHQWDDWNESFEPKRNVQSHNFVDIKRILNQDRFNAFVKVLLNERSQQQGVEMTEEKKFELLQQQNFKFDEKQVQSELMRLHKTINLKAVHMSFYIFHKIAAHLVSGLFVNLDGIEKLKAELKDKNTRIVLLPLNRSLTDLLVVEYINFLKDLQIGFFFGDQSDNTDLTLVNQLYQYCGVILLRRDQKHNANINYVNQALIEDMILKNQLTSCYQNNRRLRSGKISHPLEADDSIEWILRAAINPELSSYNIKIVPVTITYERQYDSALLTHEMISGKKVDYNAFQTIKRIYQMPSNKLGKIFVKYQEPIEVKSFIAKNKAATFEEKAFKLTTLMYKLHQKETPITHNSLVSASILFSQRPEISFKKIKSSCDTLFKQLYINKAKTYISNSPQAFDIN